MKRETLFKIVVAVGVFYALYAQGWIGAIVFISVYAIGRLIVKVAYSKAEDPFIVLTDLSMVCLVLSLILTIILAIREGKANYYSLVIAIAWTLSTLWHKLILKTE